MRHLGYGSLGLRKRRWLRRLGGQAILRYSRVRRELEGLVAMRGGQYVGNMVMIKERMRQRECLHGPRPHRSILLAPSTAEVKFPDPGGRRRCALQ